MIKVRMEQLMLMPHAKANQIVRGLALGRRFRKSG